ncbi:hypothetical protein LTR78_007228 [Recurvomyces mirabilis]|uniref:SCP domain-containing protein n=1 Tax=Recurvomyces mirabilis TaxID=574656 RepID=A0AAE0WJI7_9PEZI|nr:hypothetical protein LTR78_007228 [Recurvomyces mirabilis]KAK5155529.1 hypothetical protein LTS14_005790 [Recurvomyces mirabilis]
MRSAIIVGSFAASAFAAPHAHVHKRDVVTTVDIVVVTDVNFVTVTGDAPAAPSAPAVTTSVNKAAVPSSSSEAPWWWNWHHSYSQPSSSSAPAPSSVAPITTSVAVASTFSTSTVPAPAPPSSTPPTSSAAPTSTYVAPSSQAPASTSAPASSSQAPASSAAPSSTTSGDLTSYSGVAVAHHNLHRANHSADPLEWDAGLASTAQTIADTCVYAHSMDVDNGGYGQNIAAGVEPANISAIITDLFYNGEVGWYQDLYTQKQPDMTNFEHWGHFSQIVWKGTTHVGCATTDCSKGGLANVGSNVVPYFTVCNYKGPGNYANEYGDNVGVPLNQATAQWNTGSSVQ